MKIILEIKNNPDIRTMKFHTILGVSKTTVGKKILFQKKMDM